MRIGYARVSTIEQNEARQIKAFNDAGIERVFVDKASGKNTDRPQLKEMLSFVRDGDTVEVESYSRIARNTQDLLHIVESLNKKNVHFVSRKENIDTSTPQGRLMLTIFAGLAQFERECILDRQAEGIAIAKAEGRFKGRQKNKIDEDALKRECAKWRAGQQTAVETMKKVGLKPNTFYRRVKELAL